MKNILFIASESIPFMKTGGLADVVGTLPKYFDKEEFDVRVMIPKYTGIAEELRNKMEYVTHFYLELAWRKQYVGVLSLKMHGILFYFIDNEFYFGSQQPYGEIYQDIEKFAFFDKAVLSSLPLIGYRPDIIHCHDWQTGLVPVYLKDSFQQDDFFIGIKSILTVHNLKFQGIWDLKTVMDTAGLDKSYFAPDKLEAYGDANYLKGGLVYCDYITTVSETYAKEIKTPFYGEKLDGLINAKSSSLVGIINGIDYEEYNPMIDPKIPYHYDLRTFRKEKPKNKKAFQRELGLEEDDKRFMLGIVSRLTDQKGFDLIDYVIEEICAQDTQLVVLGTGEEKYEHLFRHFAWKYPNRVSANIFYSDEYAHKIYASCDAFLMPSLFEPCGLSQLMSLRYGTVPIVRETGGLKDTVEPYNEYDSLGTGFSFANYNAHEMLNTIRYARHIFYNKKREWNKIIDRGMAKDFSWANSAMKYESLYRQLIN
ncbi:MAG: glycogen synthase GlgA [Lachnoclostridium sp.]|nr:glycogen synthase GlgA [Lachnoclostridium sp.]